MKQVLIKRGQAIVANVPSPKVNDDTILVQVKCSCISIGTEMAGVRNSGIPLWKKALEQPEKVKKVFSMAMKEGLGKTKEIVRGKLEAGSPTGYSAAGVVVAVGKKLHVQAPNVLIMQNIYLFHAILVFIYQKEFLLEMLLL